jgi:hypothetical protein
MNQFPLKFSDVPPFWYGSFAGIWIYYAVPYAMAQALLQQQTSAGGPATFTAFPFVDPASGQSVALVNLNFMNYGAHSGTNDPNAYMQILKPVDPTEKNFPPFLGVEPATETELSIVAYPTARAAQIPDSSFSIADFIAGNDHTKTLGVFRLFVPCDDRIAVYFGVNHFGENKFMTHPYPYNIPALNNAGVTEWDFTIPGAVEEPGYHLDPKSNTWSPFIVRVTIDVSNLTPDSSNPSEILDYSMWKDSTGATRPIASRRNIFGSFNSYVLTPAKQPAAQSFALGNSTSPMLPVLAKLLGSTPTACAVQIFQSQPVIAESGPFYVDV